MLSPEGDKCCLLYGDKGRLPEGDKCCLPEGDTCCHFISFHFIFFKHGNPVGKGRFSGGRDKNLV